MFLPRGFRRVWLSGGESRTLHSNKNEPTAPFSNCVDLAQKRVDLGDRCATLP